MPKTEVMRTKKAKGKSSWSRSKVEEGCTRVQNRSKPWAKTMLVDSKCATSVRMPAQPGYTFRLE